MTYEPVRFPGWRYGPNGEADIFDCEADVPEGWLDNPNSHPSAPADDPNTANRAEMINALEARGIPFDGRWSDKRLQKLLK